MKKTTNMKRDILTVNMKREFEYLAEREFDKCFADCDTMESYYVLLAYCKRLLEVSEKITGEKKVYYISPEYLVGKLLSNNLINLRVFNKVVDVLSEYDKSIEDIEEAEIESCLGNGELGRSAVCMIDSMSTNGLAGEGLGLNYHYGYFKQVIVDHLQKAEKEPWIQERNWEDLKDETHRIRFGDRMIRSKTYSIDMIGYNNAVNRLYLFDTQNNNDYNEQGEIDTDLSDVEKNLTRYLYPDNSDEQGKLLRLYQMYFLASNSCLHILDELKARQYDLRRIDDYAVVQLNDASTALIIPEFIRVMTHHKAFSFDEAAELAGKVFALTNHSTMEETFEPIKVEHLRRVVPHLLPILREMDKRVRSRFSDPSVWIFDEKGGLSLEALALHYCFSVNGLSEVHTQVLRETTLKGFDEIYPDKIINKSNGITFRRWLLGCNRELSMFLSYYITDAYRSNASELSRLLEYAEDDQILNDLNKIKTYHKRKLADYLAKHENTEVLPDGIFAIQMQRIHEYKRQQMNVLYIIHKYLEIKRGIFPARPLNFFFAGKAATDYVIAQDIIHLILTLKDVVNNDPEVNPYLRIAFATNFNVSYAERLVTACDISEQISLASREAAGTCSMKCMLNGAVTLGTKDGTNPEIFSLVGEGNYYSFGMDVETAISHLNAKDYHPRDILDTDPVVREAVDFIMDPVMLSVGCYENLERLHKELTGYDRFLSLADLKDYIRVKDQAFADYEDRRKWTQKMLVNIAKAGHFSSDKAAADYNKDIWKLK